MSTVKSYPIIASQGKDNAFYHYCEAVQHSTPYAGCLNKLELVKQAKLPALFSDCALAISCGKCNAEGMREKELGKGVSLFYIDRAEIRAQSAAREKIAEESMALDAVSSAAKVSKRPKRINEPFDDNTPQQTSVKSTTATTTATASAANQEVSASLDFSAALARAISEEALKASEKPVNIFAPPRIEASVMQPEKITAKPSMVEIARAMSAKRKAEAQA